MTTTTYRSNAPETGFPIGKLIAVAALLAWGFAVIGGPLLLSLLVYIPAGKFGLAVAATVLGLVVGAPWFAFGLPRIIRHLRSL